MTTTISAFTFGHNLIDSGYPLVEAIRAVLHYVDEVVVVDMQSTDDTRQVLKQLASDNQEYVDRYGKRYKTTVRILDGLWGNQAGETLRQAHSKYKECFGEVIVHFEADEVFEDRLIQKVVEMINEGITDIAVHRLQLEQNWQRCRWYPEPVHRIFPRLSDIRKEGHTTNLHGQAIILGPENGYLWDITNCFRDNWISRVNKQAELRGTEPQYLMTPIHAMHEVEMTEAEAQRYLFGGRHWTWTETPFNIPKILRPLLGVTKYVPRI